MQRTLSIIVILVAAVILAVALIRFTPGRAVVTHGDQIAGSIAALIFASAGTILRLRPWWRARQSQRNRHEVV